MLKKDMLYLKQCQCGHEKIEAIESQFPNERSYRKNKKLNPIIEYNHILVDSEAQEATYYRDKQILILNFKLHFNVELTLNKTSALGVPCVRKITKKRITCCRQSWESAEVHPHLLPLHCDTKI